MKVIQHVLSDWMERNGIKKRSEAARIAGVPKSTFGDWCRGTAVPKIKAQRARLYELTKNPLFQGPLTEEIKVLSLSEYKPDKEMNRCTDRLKHLIKAIIPDLHCVVQDGSLVDREGLRQALTDSELVEFSTLARALSSEDARNLLLSELRAMKGGKS